MRAAVSGTQPSATAWLRTGLGLFIGGLCLYLAVRGVSFSDVARALAGANPAYIVLALLSVAANTVAKGVRWKVLMGAAGEHVPLRRFLAVLIVGQTLNWLLPARLGDLSRAYILGRIGRGRLFV